MPEAAPSQETTELSTAWTGWTGPGVHTGGFSGLLTVSPCGLSFCLADIAKAAQPVPALPRHLEIPSDKAQKGNSTRTQRLSSQAPRVAAGATYLQNQPRLCAAAVQACRQGRAFPKWIGPSDTSGLPRPALPNQIINRHIFT